MIHPTTKPLNYLYVLVILLYFFCCLLQFYCTIVYFEIFFKFCEKVAAAKKMPKI